MRTKKPRSPRKPKAPKPSPADPIAAAKARERRLKAIFNICSEEYEAVLAYQNGVCPITLKVPKNNLHIDHDHATGLVRGLLDPWANKGLAMFKDDPDMLRRAADYLENPPMSIALGEDVYGVVGRVSRKVKSRRYGPLGAKEPQPRTGKLYRAVNPEPTPTAKPTRTSKKKA